MDEATPAPLKIETPPSVCMGIHRRCCFRGLIAAILRYSTPRFLVVVVAVLVGYVAMEGCFIQKARGPRQRPKPRLIKSSQGLLFSEAKKAIRRGSGPDWRAGAGAWVWSSLPPGLSKESGER